MQLTQPYFCCHNLLIFIYTHFVSLLHTNSSHPNPLSDNWILSSVLGICWVYGTVSRPRVPMTINIIAAMHSKLNLSFSKQASFRAISLTTFFVFFQKSPLLSTSHHIFDSSQQLISSDFMYSIQNSPQQSMFFCICLSKKMLRQLNS